MADPTSPEWTEADQQASEPTQREERLHRALRECSALLVTALQDDDFQPCYSPRQFMCGPALRGTLERAAGALSAAMKASGVLADD